MNHLFEILESKTFSHEKKPARKPTFPISYFVFSGIATPYLPA